MLRAPGGEGGRGLPHPGCAEPSAAGALQPHGLRGPPGALGLVLGVQAAVVPGVIVPPRRAVEQGARVRRARGAEDHTGDDRRIGRGGGTEPVQGAAQDLHPGLDDAKQGMEDGGRGAGDSNGL